MTPDGPIAHPLDMAAIRELFLAHKFWQVVFDICIRTTDVMDNTYVSFLARL